MTHWQPGSLIATALGALLLCAPPAALAQTARQGGGNNAQLMQQMQQMAAERTQLAADNSRLKRELEEIRKERDKLKSESGSSEERVRAAAASVARARGERENVDAELAKSNERMTELVAKFRETIATLRTVETERTTAQQTLDSRTLDLKSCVDRNAALYTLNDEILGRLDSQGWFSGFARLEPFTRLKRTELENLAEDYRARAEDARITPGEPPTASGAPRSR